MLSHINVGTGVDCTIRGWRKPSPKWWVTKVGWFLMPQTGWHAAQTAGCDAPASAWLYHEISLEAGLASTYQWFLEIKTAFGGNDVFTSGRLCHCSRSTPLVSLDFIVENSRGEFLLAKEPTARRRVTGLCREGASERRNAGSRIRAADDGGTGARLPITAGQFYGVWQHFYDDNSPARISPLTMWCSVFASEYRRRAVTAG